MQQFSRRGDGGAGVRALLVAEHGDLLLLGPSGIAWRRVEALSAVIAVEMVDLPVAAGSAFETVQDGRFFVWFFIHLEK